MLPLWHRSDSTERLTFRGYFTGRLMFRPVLLWGTAMIWEIVPLAKSLQHCVEQDWKSIRQVFVPELPGLRGG